MALFFWATDAKSRYSIFNFNLLSSNNNNDNDGYLRNETPITARIYWNQHGWIIEDEERNKIAYSRENTLFPTWATKWSFCDSLHTDIYGSLKLKEFGVILLFFCLYRTCHPCYPKLISDCSDGFRWFEFKWGVL